MKTKTRRQLNEAKNKKLRKQVGKIKGNKPERDPKYLAFVRTHRCAVQTWYCSTLTANTITSAHMGPHGIGQKASDYTAVPLCLYHHEKIGSGIARLEAYGINYAELTKRLREEFERTQL